MTSLLLLSGIALGAPPAAEPFERHTDVAYRTDSGADKERHTLDVYTPKGKKDFPVVLFVHGGSWKSGNKNMYAALGQSLAADGLGCVICNYRLSPAVKHPGHIEDVAKAFSWTRANAAKYGGDPDKLFVCGHSAGGHLVSLLATDPQYLKAEQLAPSAIRGVASFSGVYEIVPKVKVFDGPFGTDETVCRKASPLAHVSGKHPPFFIAYADSEFVALDKMAEDMHAALKKANSPSELMKCKDRNHYTIITKFVDTTDPLHTEFRAFVAKHGK
jgi:acetyl esterase/lipase